MWYLQIRRLPRHIRSVDSDTWKLYRVLWKCLCQICYVGVICVCARKCMYIAEQYTYFNRVYGTLSQLISYLLSCCRSHHAPNNFLSLLLFLSHFWALTCQSIWKKKLLRNAHESLHIHSIEMPWLNCFQGIILKQIFLFLLPNLQTQTHKHTHTHIMHAYGYKGYILHNVSCTLAARAHILCAFCILTFPHSNFENYNHSHSAKAWKRERVMLFLQWRNLLTLQATMKHKNGHGQSRMSGNESVRRKSIENIITNMWKSNGKWRNIKMRMKSVIKTCDKLEKHCFKHR